MKAKTTVVGAVLAAAMVVGSLAGCGAQNTSKSKSTSTTTSTSKAPAKMVQLTMDQPIMHPRPKDWAAVEAAVNKITEKAIGATVKINLMDMGSYPTHFTMTMSGGTASDIMYVGTMPQNMFIGPATDGELTDLGPLLDQYGQGIKQALTPAFLRCCQINGKQYAVPMAENYATENGFTMRKDLVEKYNINLSKVKTAEDMTAIWALMKAKEPKMYPLAANQMGTVLQQMMWYDPLGDSIGVLPNWNNNLKVVNVFATPEFAKYCDLVRSWYQKGYIQPGAATSHTNSMNELQAGRAFAIPGGPSPGWYEQVKQMTGRDVVSVALPPATITTFDVARDMYCIPNSCKNKAKAMQLLNLFYTNKDLVRLVDNGIAGKDYLPVSGEPNVIKYPPGLTANQQFGLGGQGIGNSFLDYVYQPGANNLRQQMASFTKNALQSKALGFEFNPSSVKTQYAAVENVMAQYYPSLADGAVNPATAIPKFLAALKSAGINKIIAAKQQQLNAWAKANNVQG